MLQIKLIHFNCNINRIKCKIYKREVINLKNNNNNKGYK
jgi:hypothetical protein